MKGSKTVHMQGLAIDKLTTYKDLDDFKCKFINLFYFLQNLVIFLFRNKYYA